MHTYKRKTTSSDKPVVKRFTKFAISLFNSTIASVKSDVSKPSVLLFIPYVTQVFPPFDFLCKIVCLQNKVW